jgi:hypothetical protein
MREAALFMLIQAGTRVPFDLSIQVRIMLTKAPPFNYEGQGTPHPPNHVSKLGHPPKDRVETLNRAGRYRTFGKFFREFRA